MKKSPYWQTSDGTEFYHKNDAENHARTLENKTVTPPAVKAEDIEVNGPKVLSPQKSAPDTIAEIEAATSLDQLKPYAADQRKTVIAALAKKTTELSLEPVEDVIAAIEAAAELSDLEKFADDERPEVVEALATKKENLTKPE